MSLSANRISLLRDNAFVDRTLHRVILDTATFFAVRLRLFPFAIPLAVRAPHGHADNRCNTHPMARLEAAGSGSRGRVIAGERAALPNLTTIKSGPGRTPS